MVPDSKKHLTIAYPINLIKIVLLNTFTVINRKVVEEFGLKTNKYLIGVGYTGMMNSQTLDYGLQVIKEDELTECLIHPCIYGNGSKDSHTTEFSIAVDKTLEDSIRRMGFEITNFKNLLK